VAPGDRREGKEERRERRGRGGRRGGQGTDDSPSAVPGPPLEADAVYLSACQSVLTTEKTASQNSSRSLHLSFAVGFFTLHKQVRHVLDKHCDQGKIFFLKIDLFCVNLLRAKVVFIF